MNEEWRSVVGHEGAYEVSDLGRVRSLTRGVHCVRRNGEPWLRTSPGRVLRAGPSLSGHLSVVVGKGNTCAVHRLVLEAFVGVCPKGHEALHLNHNPADNRLVNLRYGTRSENIRMDYEAGNRPVPTWLFGARWRK